MAIQYKFSDEELTFGLILQDPFLFALLFWADDLSLPCSTEQKIMLTNISQRQLWCTGRKILKTLSLERDMLWAIVMNFLKPTTSLREAMFFTPRDSHIVPTRDRIFSKINRVPFFNNLIKDKNKSGGGAGIIESVNGYKIHMRIEGVSGEDENMAGIRASAIWGDELSYGNYKNHQSRIMTAYPDATWKYCGVPNGVRDSPFYEMDTDESLIKGWSHIKYPTTINPLFASKEAQDRLKQDYGGENTQGYITQVLGQWGEEAFSSFPAGSIAIDGHLPLVIKEFTDKQVHDSVDRLSTLLVLPFDPEAWYSVGLDFGFSPDPTEIIIAASKDKTTFKQIARIRLVRVKLPTQARFIAWLCSVALANRVLKVATDNSLLIQAMTDVDTFGHKYDHIMHFSNPGGTTVLTGMDGSVMPDSQGNEIKKRNKQFLTDELKTVFHTTILNTPYPRRLWLGDDKFLIDAVSGMTERKTAANNTIYETSKPDEEHPKDALLYLLSAIIESTHSNAGENWSELAKVIGWVGPTKGWKSPWD